MPTPSVPLDAIPLPALLYDAGGRIVAANALAEAVAGRHLAGLSAADVVRAFVHRRSAGTPLSPEELPGGRARAGEEVVEFPLSLTAADGRTIEILASASPLRDGDAVTGALEVWHDISALEAARAEEVRLRRESERTAEELQLQGEELRQQGDELRDQSEELRESGSSLAAANAELDRQRRLLDGLLGALPYTISLWDRDGRLAWMNDRFAADCGWHPDVLLGRRWNELGLPPAASGPLAGGTEEAMAAGTVVSREIEVPGDDGAEWRVGTFIPFGPGGVLVVMGDITGRKRAEEELRESRRKFQAMIETNVDFVWETDAEGRYTYCSPQMERLWGLRPDEMVGRTPFDVMPAGERKRALAEYKELVRDPRPFNRLESTSYDGHGNLIRIEISGVPFAGEDGAFRGYRGITRDITRRAQAEEALRASEHRQAFLLALGDRLRDLSSARELSIVAAEMVGRHLGANGVVYCEIDGAGACATVRADWTDGTVPSAAGRFRMDDFGIGELYRRGGVRRASDITTALDEDAVDEHCALRIRASLGVPIMRGGNLSAVLAVHSSRPRDWTDAEVELVRQAGDRIWGAVERAKADEALKGYAERLATSNEELRRFAYVASHDLQEPLRSIISFSQLLERRYRGQLGQDADEYIAFIVDGGNRMQRLIQDLLTFSRIETMAGEPVPVDAGRAVMDALVTFNGQIREIGATVTVGPLPSVRADPRQLEQVFANLIGNAIKYRRPEEPLEVRITAQRTNGMWEFSVADNGIGIEAEYYDRIFEMFRRLHTHDKYDGTGIGLAVVKRIVERYGGRVWVESTPGEGSTFFFTLPAA